MIAINFTVIFYGRNAIASFKTMSVERIASQADAGLEP